MSSSGTIETATESSKSTRSLALSLGSPSKPKPSRDVEKRNGYRFLTVQSCIATSLVVASQYLSMCLQWGPCTDTVLSLFVTNHRRSEATQNPVNGCRNEPRPFLIIPGSIHGQAALLLLRACFRLIVTFMKKEMGKLREQVLSRRLNPLPGDTSGPPAKCKR